MFAATEGRALNVVCHAVSFGCPCRHFSAHIIVGFWSAQNPAPTVKIEDAGFWIFALWHKQAKLYPVDVILSLSQNPKMFV